MRRERVAKLQRRDGARRASTPSTCSRAGTSSTRPARGCSPPTTDAPRIERTTALLVRGDDVAPPLHALSGGRAAGAAAPTTSTPPLWHETDAGRRRARAARSSTPRRRRRAADRRRRLHRADVVRAAEAAGARSSSRTRPRCSPSAACTRRADELECMRRSWRINEAATYAAEQALRPGIRLTDLTAIVLPPVLRARRNVQLPRPGVAEHAGAHRRRPVEHERRRALRARHRRPLRDATATSSGPTRSPATRATRPTSGAPGSSGAPSRKPPRPVRALAGHHRRRHRRDPPRRHRRRAHHASRSTPTAAPGPGSTTTSSPTRSASRAASPSASAPTPAPSTTSSSCSSRA